MQLASGALEGGFADPVIDAQSIFRVVMDAMACPALPYRLGREAAPSAPLGAAMAALACALADADTPVWLDPPLASDAVRAWLAFHTGAPFAAAPGEAAFALVGDPSALPPLERFAQGTAEYPDRSTTLLLRLPSLDDGPRLTFAGPGISGRASLAPEGLPGDFGLQWRANRARFPRGVDLILVAGDGIACLPRSARLVEEN